MDGKRMSTPQISAGRGGPEDSECEIRYAGEAEAEAPKKRVD